MQPASPIRFALAGMIAMAAAMGIGRFVYTPALPSMMAELGLSAGQAGAIASSNFAGYLLGAILSAGAWASGRERWVLLLGLAANAILTAAMGVSQSFASFMLIRFCAGLASAFVMIFVSAIVFSHLAAASRSDLQSVHFAGVGFGIVSSALITAGLHDVGAAWYAVWYGAASLAAIALIYVTFAIDRGPVASGIARTEPPLPKSSALTAVIAAYGLFGFGYIVTATFLVTIVRNNGEGPLFESLVWLVTGIAGLPSIYAWTKIAQRVGLGKAYALTCFVETVGVLASVLVAGRFGPLLGGALLGGTFIAATALGLQLGRQLAPQSPRRVLALMTASFGVGQIIGPVVAGIVAEWTGSYLWPSAGAALALVISGLLVLRKV